jgi:hypothetical protein
VGALPRKKGADWDRREQLSQLQSPPGTALGLSCREIRRLFWQLVVAGQRSATAVLHWSGWRRWHQAWARYYHTRRRDMSVHQAADPTPSVPPGEVLEVVWQRLAARLPPPKRKGRPYVHERRVVLEAIVYLMQTGCTWHTLPSCFPPWQTVYAQLTQWRRTGMWDRIWEGLEVPHAAE